MCVLGRIEGIIGASNSNRTCVDIILGLVLFLWSVKFPGIFIATSNQEME